MCLPSHGQSLRTETEGMIALEDLASQISWQALLALATRGCRLMQIDDVDNILCKFGVKQDRITRKATPVYEFD